MSGQADGAAAGVDSLRERVRSRNPKMQRLVDYAVAVAKTPYAVLLEGETGTGKEVFARGIHAASGRPGPFVPLNCAAVPDTMFEAELFGARRGAYTGLVDERPGLLSVADRGTLFLDEIADMPLPMQSKLLRVLEDGEIRPLGGTRSLRVDVRVIAATHRFLKPLVESGRFRRDLYFRLSAACIRLPPLRDRPEDIPLLVDAAVDAACRLQNVPRCSVSRAAINALMQHPWPGNIRELNNCIAAAVLRAQGAPITPPDLQLSPSAPAIRATDAGDRGDDDDEPPWMRGPFFDALEAFEARYLRSLLRASRGNLSEASRISGLSRSAIRSKARAYGLLGDGDGAPGVAARQRVRKPPRE
ncbi:MAG: sigma-54-dependent Fis family transcriptional regulator [Deltaproteobacteria bacterium]|nr:MAG: sigma-54-dependent Fis family transcriptional regulator [Deltaproteobacteria bacterium]